jgi:two-component system LytT family sensor kinase
MSTLFHTSGRRYPLAWVALAIFGAAFLLVVVNYLVRFLYNAPFNWPVFWEYFPNLLLGTVTTTLFSFWLLNYFYFLFSHRKRAGHFILPVLLTVAIIQGYNLLVDHYLPLENNIDDPLPLNKQIVGNLLLAATYLFFILSIAYVTNLRDIRKKHRVLEQQKLQLEVEKAQAELKFLKSQINPHFLHNTLNSFYARSLPLSQELAGGILTLSEMMRYALGETHTTDGKVLLKDEIEHLRNLVNIHQFRFRNHLNVELDVRGDLNGALIIPFVLITLVENIFKHGDLSSADHATRIKIEVKNGSLCFRSTNKKKSGPRELSTGIGLDNIKKRLDLSYGNGYDLIIGEDAETYSTELLIHQL